MQKKVDILVDIINKIPSIKQRKYAYELLQDIVSIQLKQSAYIDNLESEQPGEIDKYVALLRVYGFTQENISLLNNETIWFVFTNINQLKDRPTYSQLYNIQIWMGIFKNEFNRIPDSITELAKYMRKEID